MGEKLFTVYDKSGSAMPKTKWEKSLTLVKSEIQAPKTVVIILISGKSDESKARGLEKSPNL